MSQSTLEQAVAELQRKELEAKQAKVREAIGDIQAKVFDKAQAYTNIVV